MESREEALVQLFHTGLPEAFSQLRLAEDTNLEQLGVIGLEVAEHSQFLKGFVGQVLPFVQNDNDVTVLGELVEQVFLEAVCQLEAVGVSWCVDREFRAQGSQELIAVQIGIGDHGALRPVLYAPEEHSTDQRFSGADFPRDEHEALAFLGSVLKRGQGFLVFRRAEVERRIGRVVERQPVQPKV
jgi:hypothetical protein